MLLLRNIILLCAFAFTVQADDTSSGTTASATPSTQSSASTVVTTASSTAPTVPAASSTAPTVPAAASATPAATTQFTNPTVVITETSTAGSVFDTSESAIDRTSAEPELGLSTGEGTGQYTTDNPLASTTTTEENEEESSNLALILGLSLGIGIPVLLAIIGLIYYFVVYKPKNARVRPSNNPGNETIGAVTEIPLKPTKTSTRKAEVKTEEF